MFEAAHANGERLRAEPPPLAARARERAPVAGEEDAHVELVAVLLDVLEEALDAGEPLAAVVHPLPVLIGELGIRARGVHAALLRRLEQPLLMALPGGMRPRRDGAVGEAPAPVGHDEGLVVAQDVPEPLALRAGAERMVEREEQGPRARQGHAARRAAKLPARPDDGAADDLDGRRALAFGERGLEGIGQSAPSLGSDDHAVEHHAEPLAVARRRQRGGPATRIGEVDDAVADLDPREAALDEHGGDGGEVLGRGGGQGEADEGPRARMVSEQGLGDLVRGIAPSLRPAGGAVDAADLREEQAQVVVHLRGGAHRGARRAHGVLLLERDGGTDVLDPVDVGPVEPLEEHARVGGERLDVAPLALGEQGVEGERGFPRSRDARDHGHPVVGNVDRDVLQVVLAGSLDAEPRGLRHSPTPPEVESVPERSLTGQRAHA